MSDEREKDFTSSIIERRKHVRRLTRRHAPTGTHPANSHSEIEHTHTHTQTKAVLNRMARLIGHLKAIKQMIADGRDCSEVLTQLSAVDSAIKAVSRIIIKDHMEHCIVDAINDGDSKSVENLRKAIEQFIK